MILSFVEFVGTVRPGDPFRSVGQGIPQHGWEQFFSGRAEQDMAWGAGGLLLHMPFGDDGSKLYQFDGWKRCKDQRLFAVTDDFLSAAQRWRARHPTARLCIYAGCVAAVPPNADPATWLHYVAESVEWLKLLGAELMLDATSASRVTSDDYALATLIRNRGVCVWGENRPAVGFGHWASFGTVCDWSLWQDAEQGKWHDKPIPAAQLAKVCILMLANADKGWDYNNLQWAIDGTKAANKSGYDVAVTVDEMRDKKISAAQLVS